MSLPPSYQLTGPLLAIQPPIINHFIPIGLGNSDIFWDSLAPISRFSVVEVWRAWNILRGRSMCRMWIFFSCSFLRWYFKCHLSFSLSTLQTLPCTPPCSPPASWPPIRRQTSALQPLLSAILAAHDLMISSALSCFQTEVSQMLPTSSVCFRWSCCGQK